jgi:NAD(P)-dependent dehydrogenase (short-subunit alcohol dehydrogenase family)
VELDRRTRRPNGSKLGTIDVLIHLMEGWAGGQPLQDFSLDTWERMFDVNLRPTFLCSRAVLPIMRPAGTDRVPLE